MPPKKKAAGSSKKAVVPDHQVHLQAIKNFDTKRLKRTEFTKVVKEYEDNDGTDVDLKGHTNEVTLNPNELCFKFWDGQAYPVHEIKSVVQQIPESAEVTLNFAGIAAVTDIVFAVMANLRQTESARFEAVKRVVLDGCHMITDAGLAWLGEAFTSITRISLVGCYKISGSGLISLSKSCPRLLSIDLRSTNVSVLPQTWSSAGDLQIKISGSPLLFPGTDANSKSKSVEPLKESFTRICILTRGRTSTSVLAAIKGEKQPSKISWPQIQSNMEISTSLTAVIVEADQSLSSAFIANHSVIVIPCELQDEAKLPEEVASISALILEILGKFPQTHFLLIGCKIDAASTNNLKEMVEKYLNKTAQLIKDTNYSLASVEQLSLVKQLEYSRARQLYLSLSSVHINAAVIDLEKPDKDLLLKELAKSAESLDTVSHICGNKKIYKWAKEFHSKCPKSLQSGIHKLNEAEDIITDNLIFGKKGTSVGAVKFLANIGKLILWENRKGETLVANAVWLCECLQILLSPDQACTINNGLDHIIADEASVWSMEKLKEEASNMKLDWEQVQIVMMEFPYLWLVTDSGLTSLDHLPDQPKMSTLYLSYIAHDLETRQKMKWLCHLMKMGPNQLPLCTFKSQRSGLRKMFTEFDRKTDQDGLHIVYSFVLNHNITPGVLQEIFASAVQLHRPIHIWKTGLIIYDSIVAVMIEQTDYRKVVNLCAYVTSTPKDGMDKTDSNAKLIYSTLEKYKMIITHSLTCSGFIWELLMTASDSIQKPPEDVNGVVHSHRLNAKESGVCTLCGTTSTQSSVLTAIEMTLNPVFLTEDHVKSQEMNGVITGSLIELTGPSELNFSAQLDPLGCRQCSVLMMKGSVQLLMISFISPEKYSITIDLAENRIISTANESTETFDISSLIDNISLEGEVLTAKIKNDNPFLIDIYKGQSLLQSVPMPYSSYSLTISSKSFSSDGLSAMFTIQSSNFKARVVEIVEGMRLEAMDRLNPHLICVATIAKVNIEAGKVLIHFDGWTQRYDYWAELDHRHLHPIGYMHYKGKELATNYNINPDLQAPHGYAQEFDWLTYLKEVGAEPVPYSYFNKKQTEGAPDDIIREIEGNLGHVFSLSEKELSLACCHNQWRAHSIEHQTELYIAKFEEGNQEIEQELSLRKHFVCLLPPSLSVESLRFPALNSVFSDEQQNLHFLCPGQVLDIHHVNHTGLPLVSQHLKSWLKGLQNIYAYLMVQKQTLPHLKSAFCTGTEMIPESKWLYLEAAMRRLYKLYLMHCFFFWTHPMDFTDEQSDVIENMLEAALKSEDHTFSHQFISLPGTNQVLCHAHKLANSPSSNLLEISVDKFQSLASSIYVIHLENNPLSLLPLDFFSHFVNLTHLWLDGCKISELPSLQKNTCLEEIHMKGNVLTTLPDDIKQLTSLRILDISNNHLEVLPSVISSLESLVELYADNIGIIDLTVVCPLKNLTKLSVGQNYIDHIPGEIAALPLTVLDMSGLPLMPMGSTFSKISLNKHLDQFTIYRRIPTQERQEIMKRVENIGTKISSSAKISELNKILLEKYPRLGRMKAPEDANIPEAILKIKTLERLVIPYHTFKSVPDSIQNLTSLEYLNVGCNPRLETISANLALLPIKELHLKDCPSLKTPPREVVRRGFLSVFGFLKRLLQGSVSCKRTKLMMVGLGGAGKTSLVNALTSERYQFYQDYGEMITDGINISEWVVPINQQEASEDPTEVLHFSVWDFAGQTVYYNTHQFFLSNRAVYLLLWNIRLGFEHAGLDFWLSSIACHAPKAPIFVVGSHCDKVQKGKLPKEELKRRFPQIMGFHFISSYTGEGISVLKEELIEAALSQKYMGEMIPEAWLNLETKLDNVRRNEEKALLPWKEIEECAGAAGIFDKAELIQAVQFLHDLGSVQFFNTNFLRSYVVIIPQWIIDVMACIVTVHEGPTKDGKLCYSDMKEVWQKYPEELHPWLLRLTEEFDLTFPLPSEEANIVPCLLANTEPKFDYPPVDKESSERESIIMYRFEYLPAGLFNRAQVRLHEFSDSSVMWKKGVLLKKNNHRALLVQVNNTEVIVTARGYKPENIIFLVHEVFECLITDSYSGVSYDYSIPCVECLAEFTLDPCMFSASKIKRATDMKVPFLQCDKYFHIVSIPEIQAIMPPDNTSDFDEHLGRSVRELQDLEDGMGIQVLFVYTQSNIPDLANMDKVVDPTKVLEDLRSAGCNVSYCDNPETANMESMTLSLKSAQIVIFGMSEEFIADAQCCNLIIYTKQTLHKSIIILALGKTLNWQEMDINLILADEIFIKMTEFSRYNSKLPELLDAIKTRSQKKKVVYPECFISYSWANSKMAVELGSATVDGAISWGDPRKIKDFLQSNGVNCWIDVEQMGQEGFFEDIADGLRKAKVMIACVSDEYAKSKNCRMEFRFAVSTLKIPTVLAVVGTGYSWERSEIGLLTVGHSLFCPKINLQYENDAGLLDLLKEVQRFLPQSSDVSDDDASVNIALKQAIAFQEALELAQRKLLRHIVLYSGTIDMESYPRLVLIDLQLNGNNINAKTEEPKAKRKDSVKDAKQYGNIVRVADASNTSEDKNTKYCFRLLCEHEQGWHESPQVISFPKMELTEVEEFLRSVSPYVARVLAILKHSKINLPILISAEGEQLCRKMEEWCPRTSPDFQTQYKMLIQMVLEEDEARTYGGLKRCQMSNGKMLWLCEKHDNSSLFKSNETYCNKLQQDQELKIAVTEEEIYNTDVDTENTKSDPYELLAPGASQELVTDEDIPAANTQETPQLAVKLVQPAGQLLPRRPKLTRRNTSSKKNTSQSCQLM